MAEKKNRLSNLTIVIPTYNRQFYLNKLLNTLPVDINIIVSDNGMFLTDEFKAKFINVKFILQDLVIDALQNWNKCIKAVNTDWFMIPSDDDLYYEKSFDIIEKYINQYQNADLLIFGHNVINENDDLISEWRPKKLLEMAPPSGFNILKYGVEARFPSMLFKTSKVQQLGYIDESYKLTAGDSKLIQMIALTGKVVFIPEIIGAYRTWPNNSTVLTLGTAGWLAEIDRWQNDIEYYIKNQIPLSPVRNFKKIRDEVYGRNLVGSIINKKAKSNFRDVLFFLKNVRFPWHASFITKLKILKALLLK
ncbi:glycosyltransferase family 2 protein [Mucilaginibacter segetis]|uniref:Glycosyltransferase 2-like domain-containing protein n=1 Tax=Mucilaginibacter segetis TaxID=2793071 RepID=A0A934PUM4_9SPHI|nr:glycosyltransferase [Mucilaginibacter segetis]MBK0381138.1 hypothetical protein [Mucilaginibacter segetis]